MKAKMPVQKEGVRRYQRTPSFCTSTRPARRVCPGRHSSQNPSTKGNLHGGFIRQIAASYNLLELYPWWSVSFPMTFFKAHGFAQKSAIS